jgi:hypothetical protein
MFIQRAVEMLLSAPELCCVFAPHFLFPLFEVQFRHVLCCELDQSIARDVFFMQIAKLSVSTVLAFFPDWQEYVNNPYLLAWRAFSVV